MRVYFATKNYQIKYLTQKFKGMKNSENDSYAVSAGIDFFLLLVVTTVSCWLFKKIGIMRIFPDNITTFKTFFIALGVLILFDLALRLFYIKILKVWMVRIVLIALILYIKDYSILMTTLLFVLEFIIMTILRIMLAIFDSSN